MVEDRVGGFASSAKGWDVALRRKAVLACGEPLRSLSHQKELAFFVGCGSTVHHKIKEVFCVKKFSVRDMVYISLMIALNIVLSRIASIRIPIGGVEIGRIGFGGFPIIYSSIAFGPLAGGIVGTVGDIIGYWINPMGAYMPHFTLSAALTGIIPGLVLKPFDRSEYTFWQLVLAIGIGQTITSVIMVPYFHDRLFNIPMIATIPGKIKGQIIHVPLYAYMTKIIMKRVSTVINTANN